MKMMNKDINKILSAFKDGVADVLLIVTREEPTAKKNNYYHYYKQGYDFGITLWWHRNKEENENAKRYQVNYSKNNKLFSRTINATNKNDAEEKAIKKFKITDDDIRSVVKGMENENDE